MGIRSQKKEAEAVLRNWDQTSLIQWAESSRNPFRVLISMTYHRDELIRWRAIEATGWVAGVRAETDLDAVQDMVRRLLWQMNDESGSIIWHSSEMIGEILVNVPVLIPEYADVLLAFLHEEPFERGTHLAISRAAQVNPKPFVERVSELASSLANPDPAIRAYTVLALGALKKSSYNSVLKRLTEDDSRIQYYDMSSGNLVTLTIGEVASKAIEQINSNDRAA